MWMAPEIIMGKKYTEKADVFAMGIIIWEILTRLEPYEDKEPMQIVVEVVNDGLRPTLPQECAESPLVPLMKSGYTHETMKQWMPLALRGLRPLSVSGEPTHEASGICPVG
jgi:serine/threonine protein kinase